MANDLTNTVMTAYRLYYQAMSQYNSYQHLTAPIRMNPSDYSITDQEIYGLSIWRDFAASPTAQDIKSLSHTTTVTDKEILASISIPDIVRNPGILNEIMVRAGNLFGYTLDQLFWAVVSAAATTAHPHQGAAVFNSENPLYMVDDFTIKPPGAANTPGGATVSQSNAYSYSFDADNIAAMVADRAGYFDISGNAVEADPGMDAQRPIVFGDAAHRHKAGAIMEQMGPVYDGSGVRDGVKSLVDPSGYVSPPAGNLTSGEFGLWYRRLEASQRDGVIATGPVAPVIFYDQTIEITRSSDSNHMHVIGYGGVAVRVSGNVHTDLQLSTP